MNSIRIGRALKTGWRLFNQRAWYLLGLSLAVAALFVLVSPNNAFAAALAYILYGGYLAVMLKHFHGEHIVFDDMFTLDQRWISLAFLGVIKGILIMLGLVLFIVPGIYLAVRWMFAELFVIDEGLRPLEALKASSELTKGHRWKLFLYAIVVILLLLLGLLALIIGSIIVSVIVVFGTIQLYYDLKSLRSQTSQEVTPEEG